MRRCVIDFRIVQFDLISLNANSLLLSIGTISTSFTNRYNNPLCFFQVLYNLQLLEKCLIKNERVKEGEIS